ncbi:MAG: SusC/RagA family TonB-linked outer membrane protein [Candidatus Cryptobacteroides sp.]
MAFLILLAFPLTSRGQESVKVSGVITSSEDGLPIIGAAVVAGPSTGAVTDLDGWYEISVREGTVLEFSAIGFEALSYTVPSGRSEIVFNPVLAVENLSLENAVVIAYGVRKKGTVAGSVSSVKADKLENSPTPAFDQALQGQVAGLTVLSSTGEPSASASMIIRGTNSINSGTAPLYILDGVAISASDFNTVNPADIESMSVLKDASSTSIYGARAANGVIVITTKRGRTDRPSISFKTQTGISSIAYGKWDLMNTEERIQYEIELGMDEGQDYNFLRQTDVNWLDAVYNNRALLTSNELSIAGADDNTNYFVSASYYNQDGIAPASAFERYSLRFNFDQKMGRILKMETNTMFNYQNIMQSDEGSYTLVTPISAARFMLPYWNPYKEDGSLASINDGSWLGQGQNPLEWIENNPLKYKKYKALSVIYAELEPVRNLKFRTQASFDYTHTEGFSQSYPSYAPNQDEGSASRSSSTYLNLQVSNTLTYSFNINREHDFTFLLGQEGENYHSEGFSLQGKGTSNDKLTDIAFATRVTSWSSWADADYSRVSFFGRGEYNYQNRFYGELSLRTDGSSRFGKNNRWGVFGAAGFMWDLRNEAFFAPYREMFTTAQLSISSGTSGNSSIPNYEHLALIGSSGDYLGDSALVPVQPGNEDLTWESCWTTNFAIHLGLWGRLTADIELYNKYTTNMLMQVPLSYAQSNGYGYRWDNVGAMTNRGVELNLSADVLRAGKFSWNINANVGYNRNRIVELYGGVTEYENANTNTKLVVGHPLGEFYLNRYAGVNPANGDALWYDAQGNITNELNDEDKVLTGKSFYAPWQGGFGTSLSYGGLTLSAQFSWVADRWMINNDRYFDESNGRFSTYNQSRRLLNRWKEPGDITDIPRHGVYTEFDSRLLEDASFLRLKNLMLSYNTGKLGFIQNLRVYLQAQNLLTFTNFSGLDPEGVSNIYAAQYPMSRQFTIGLDFNF